METASFSPGDVVVMHKLVSRPEWEGRRAVVAGHHQPTDQWLVQFEGENRKRLFKAQNLLLASTTSDVRPPTVVPPEPPAAPSRPISDLRAAPVASPEPPAVPPPPSFGRSEAQVDEAPSPAPVFAPDERELPAVAPAGSNETARMSARRALLAQKSAAAALAAEGELASRGAAEGEGSSARKPRTFGQMVQRLHDEAGAVAPAQPLSSVSPPLSVREARSGPSPQKERSRSPVDGEIVAAAATAPAAVPPSDGFNRMQAMMTQRFSDLEQRLAEHERTFAKMEAQLAEKASQFGGQDVAAIMENLEQRLLVAERTAASQAALIARAESESRASARQLQKLQEEVATLKKSRASPEATRQNLNGAQVVAGGHSDVASVALQLQALQDYFASEGLLTQARFDGMIARKKFLDYCAATGFTSSATLGMLFDESVVVSTVKSYLGSDPSMMKVREASTKMRDCTTLLAVLAQEQVTTSLRAAAEGRIDLTELRRAIDLADHIGSTDDSHLGRVLLRGQVSDQLHKVLDNSDASMSELAQALQMAQDAGLPQSELNRGQTRLADLQQERAAAERKLKAARAWLNASTCSKLAAAIAEAEKLDVDPEEIRLAKAALREVKADPHDADLIAFLRAARPQWTASELEAVRTKLARVDIANFHKFAIALRNESLTQRLREAKVKTFSGETLDAFNTELCLPRWQQTLRRMLKDM